MRPTLRASLAALAAAFAVAGAVAPAPAAEVRGRLELIENGVPVADVAAAVIWYEPDGGGHAAPKTVEVTTRGKRFIPRVTPVPLGSTVHFPNEDKLVHNVFSVSPGNRFDLGRYGQGEAKSQRFAKPGLVRVYCNVHHGMVAYVLVVDTPHVAAPDASGAFALEGVPAGKGKLTIWHERAGTWTRAIDTASAEPLIAKLAVTQARLPTHLDKNGRPYADEERDDGYR